ncbi:helix-turn-helix transcriptional regulator [Sinomicrobium weinanense]|uniref:Helix-turn-helix transcriptional regulator n=1 Tax=Sinomicrobium weinanense TaxID=2842200 RepID=A0A926JVX6_9FLAO|nr:helix-turn-helix transcriptional regulator [Sinomicrobium weinanense]MBC9798349.1 helix-turn-helix transcriptional regulator [Sinomicrobium weinanense]MBU3122504.1 helix-turn-helix domain-containing protein [Sinomicrobium weinanense]
MVNIEDFSKRLQEVLDYYGLSASSFADRIGVQRSSISHILSGRNKPSLDFVLKILQTFPEVELYWLLNGKGVFPSEKQKTPKETKAGPSPDLFSGPGKTLSVPENTSFQQGNAELERIVFFYKDGTFKEYRNEN